jgi:hypothetical protein
VLRRWLDRYVEFAEQLVRLRGRRGDGRNVKRCTGPAPRAVCCFDLIQLHARMANHEPIAPGELGRQALKERQMCRPGWELGSQIRSRNDRESREVDAHKRLTRDRVRTADRDSQDYQRPSSNHASRSWRKVLPIAFGAVMNNLPPGQLPCRYSAPNRQRGGSLCRSSWRGSPTTICGDNQHPSVDTAPGITEHWQEQ